MIVSLALILAAAFGSEAVPPLSAVDEEIVVIGKKLEMIKFDLVINKNGRIMSCTITQSSGDEELDSMLCDALRSCNSQFQFNRKNRRLLPPCVNEQMIQRRQTVAEMRVNKNATNN